MEHLVIFIVLPLVTFIAAWTIASWRAQAALVWAISEAVARMYRPDSFS